MRYVCCGGRGGRGACRSKNARYGGDMGGRGHQRRATQRRRLGACRGLRRQSRGAGDTGEPVSGLTFELTNTTRRRRQGWELGRCLKVETDSGARTDKGAIIAMSMKISHSVQTGRRPGLWAAAGLGRVWDGRRRDWTGERRTDEGWEEVYDGRPVGAPCGDRCWWRPARLAVGSRAGARARIAERIPCVLGEWLGAPRRAHRPRPR